MSETTDLAHVWLSGKASDVADQLCETGKFSSSLAASRFALAYALKNYYDTFEPGVYQVSDQNGKSWNSGVLDKDHSLASLLNALYPDANTPYLYARSLMDFGLRKIGELIEREGMPNISDLCV